MPSAPIASHRQNLLHRPCRFFGKPVSWGGFASSADFKCEMDAPTNVNMLARDAALDGRVFFPVAEKLEEDNC